jgi:hypothetical protein
VVKLIEYAKDFNKGQGIGFVIFGTTVNRRVLLTVFGCTVALVPLAAKLLALAQSSSQEVQIVELSGEVEQMREDESRLLAMLNASASIAG